jgi:hypothetical protein
LISGGSYARDIAGKSSVTKSIDNANTADSPRGNPTRKCITTVPTSGKTKKDQILIMERTKSFSIQQKG